MTGCRSRGASTRPACLLPRNVSGITLEIPSGGNDGREVQTMHTERKITPKLAAVLIASLQLSAVGQRLTKYTLAIFLAAFAFIDMGAPAATASPSASAVIGAERAAPRAEKSYEDPLTEVERQGLVGPATVAAKNAADARNKAAKNAASGGSASQLQPVALAAIVPGATKSRQHGLTVHRAPGNRYGVIVGTGQQGLNAGYIVINEATAPIEYRFTVGDTSTHLNLNPDGSVTVNNSAGQQVNYIQPAWATSGFTGLGGAAVACAIGGPVAAADCALAAGSIGSTAQYADNHGQCVGLSFWGIYPAIGWNPFAYTGPQCR